MNKDTLGGEDVIPCGYCKGTGSVTRGHKGVTNVRHGHTSYNRTSPTYTVWTGMRNRCNNPKYHNYFDYGGRGITLCERWSSFENFLEDMGERPEGMSLDRINNDKGYSPENCKWSTRTEQNNNTRRSVFIEYKGERMTAAQWSKKLGYEPHVISWRVRQGWSTHDTLTIKPTRNTPTSKGRMPRSKAAEL